jgi:hypothetical protein
VNQINTGTKPELMKFFENRTKLAALAAAPLLALAIAFIFGGALTQHASAQNPPSSKVFAVGAITTATFEHVAFSAHTEPKTNLATAVTGYVVQEYTDGTASNSGPVTCFNVDGTTAFIRGNYVRGKISSPLRDCPMKECFGETMPAVLRTAMQA